MKYLCSLYVLLAMLWCRETAIAKVIWVTNNEDYGANTLRSALDSAYKNLNDEFETDYIYFNLPGDREIVINYQLPSLSSNLVIDATTQPATGYGVAGTKVTLSYKAIASGQYYEKDEQEDNYFVGPRGSLFYMYLQQDVAIYGLYFFNRHQPLELNGYYAITAYRCNNIVIGGPGKGNLFTDFNHPLFFGAYTEGKVKKPCSNVTVQGNTFGLDPQGSIYRSEYLIQRNFPDPTLDTIEAGPGVLLEHTFGQIKIGGDAPGEGNTFASGFQFTEDWTSPYSHDSFKDPHYPSTFEISGNSFGTDFQRQLSVSCFNLFSFKGTGPEDLIRIRNNTFGGNRDTSACALNFSRVKARLIIEKNRIGVNAASGKFESKNGFIIQDCPNVLISKNEIGHIRTPFDFKAGAKVELSKNKIYCCRNIRPLYQVAGDPVPDVYATALSGNSLSGKANPGSRVELFYTDTCGTCNPERYLGSTTADAGGNWSYTITEQLPVVASATLNGISSEFSPPFLSVTIDQAPLPYPTCKSEHVGRLTGLQIQSPDFYTYQWKTERGVLVGESINLQDVMPGKYYLEITLRNACNTFRTPLYEIQELPDIVADTTSIQRKNPDCNNTGGSIRGIRSPDTELFKWYQNNVPVPGANSADLVNAPEGSYTLKLTNSNCVKNLGPFELKKDTVPNFPEFEISKIYPCENTGGQLKVSVKAGEGVFKPSWVKQSGEQVSADAVAANIPGGMYELYLTAPNACRIKAATIYLQSVSAAEIDESLALIAADSCTKNTGSVSKLSIRGGKGPYTYRWLDEADALIDTSLNLGPVKAGSYRLEVRDSTACVASKLFTLQPFTTVLEAPKVRDVQLCTPGPAVINIQSKEKGRYCLYESETDTAALTESGKGFFQIEATGAKTYYISIKDAGCESPRTPVKVTVSAADIKFSNLVSPNGDGINDTWQIANIESYSLAFVQIFNRLGAIVFKQMGYSKPFDGTVNGKDLSAGTYYYVVELNKECKPITGSLTLIR